MEALINAMKDDMKNVTVWSGEAYLVWNGYANAWMVTKVRRRNNKVVYMGESLEDATAALLANAFDKESE